MIKMNIPVIFQFLKDLSANNNRDWFNEHRAEYETARVEFENFLATVIARISLFDESIVIHAFLRIKLRIKYILAVISMQKEKNPIIVAIMCICNLLDLCLPEGAYACRLTY